MRRLPLIAALLLLPALAGGQDGSDRGRSGAAVAADRERAALAFVRKNHPELAELLKVLKAMDRPQYDTAIRDLVQTSEMIARVEQRNPERAALLLTDWKADSRVDLLTARLLSDPGSRREPELRKALADQIAAQLALQKYDRAKLRERLAQMDQQIERLERRGEKLVDDRLDAINRRVERAQRKGGGPEPAADRPEEGGQP